MSSSENHFHLFPNRYPFQQWLNPSPEDIGETTHDFLQRLDGPAHIILTGTRPDKQRVIVTLLHGNEPSGLMALFTLIKNAFKPFATLHFLIASVTAAKEAPAFSHRMLPGRPDLNRCFKTTENPQPEHLLAKGIVDTIGALRPEAVIDVHNTSGNGPGFGVTTFLDSKHDILTGLFCDRQIVTDLKLGALMEISEHLVPTVTIECGGAKQQQAHNFALGGIMRFATVENLFDGPKPAMDIFHNPMRLEIKKEASLCYATSFNSDFTLTLLPDIENLNFGYVNNTTILGFLNREDLQQLTIKTATGEDNAAHYFCVIDDTLRPKIPMKFFMVTTNAEIAKRDCILYLVPASDENDQREI